MNQGLKLGISFSSYNLNHFRDRVGGGSIPSKMGLLRLVDFFFSLVYSEVLCYVLFAKMGHVQWCKQLFPLHAPEAGTIIFPCSVLSSKMVSYFLSLLLCTFSGKYTDWQVPKIARYRVQSLEGTTHPRLKCLCSQKAGIKLTASCCLSVKQLTTKKCPVKTQPFWVRHFPELQD